MEPSKHNFRFYIFARIKLGLEAKEIHGELADISQENEPSFDTVARWIRHFTDGRDSLDDEERSGRPPSSLTKDIVARTEAIVTEDRRITLIFIAAELSISFGSAYNIMHDELRGTKRCARFQ